MDQDRGPEPLQKFFFQKKNVAQDLDIATFVRWAAHLYGASMEAIR
jgi:hypothetical protein